MNFEFLKGLTGLGHVYVNCCNAEKLALTMPVQSVFTSRKGAEVLAKFIYMAALNQEIKQMTFNDILRDDVFRRYVNSSEIMKAFHHIRTSGNMAVHEEGYEAPAKEAITVLQDLHYVTGEVARMMGLIDKYPKFNRRIDAYPDEKYIEDSEIEKKAQKMFLEYVEKYDAQVERERFYKRKVDKLKEDFLEASSPIKIDWKPGIIHSHETIEFKNKLLHSETVQVIQDHFGFMGMQTVRFLQGELEEDRVYNFNCELTVYGEDGYTTTDLGEFMHGVLFDLPEAEGFKIVTFYEGPNFDPGKNNGEREFFENAIEKINRDEVFVYKIYERLDISGEAWCGKYENGEWVNLADQYNPDIINKSFKGGWESNQLHLAIIMDNEKYPEIFSALNDVTRMYFSDQDLICLEDFREDGDDSSLLIGVDWDTDNLQEIQSYLDDLNAVLAPILNECDGDCEGSWYLNDEPFGVATWVWTPDGFRIVGTEM